MAKPPEPDPTIEIGNANNGIAPWSSFFDASEDTPELRFPGSIRTYDQMRNDDQISALLLSFLLPIYGYRWYIEPNGARDEVVEHTASDFGLPIEGQDAPVYGRSRDRFSHEDYLRHALLKLVFGAMFFEQVYRLGDDNKLHIRKLAPRMPGTLQQIQSDRDGGLLFIRQFPSGQTNDIFSPRPAPKSVLGEFFTGPEIPVSRLVGHVNEKEGGNWYGRALALDTPIPTPDGWKTMADLEVGDRVFDETGAIRHVVATQEWEDRPCYRLTFPDKSSIVADENHLWVTQTARERHAKRDGQLRSSREIAETSDYGVNGSANHGILWAKPVEHVRKPQLVDPYVLGLWLGDGTSVSGEIAAHAHDVEEERRFIEDAGYATKSFKSGRGDLSDRITVYGLRTQLRALQLLGDKHFPDGYLDGSIDQRLALLQGLMDSDGHVNAFGQCEFGNCNTLLINGVQELVRSLGGQANILKGAGPGKDRKQQAWKVTFTPPPGLRPFRFARKVDRLESRGARGRMWHYIRSVEVVEPRTTKCIEVDGPSHMFLAGEGFVPTHNCWLRSLYRNWLMKDRLLRVDALKHERNGMGVPTGKSGPGTTNDSLRKLLSIVTRWKAGDTAAAALPPGTDIELKGVQGSLPDTLGSIRYHDEQIARRFIGSVFQLGSTQTGARSLGDTLIEVMNLAQQSVAKSYADVTNEHVIEDLVDLNYSIDENAPLLRFRPDADRKLAVADLVSLIQANGITVDDELERYIRAEWNLPKLEGPRPEQPPQLSAVAASAGRDRIVMSLNRPRNAAEQRKPNAHEKAAKTDFEALNRSYEDALSFLITQWNAQVKPDQITSLVDQIAASVTFDDLATISAPVLGSDLLTSELQRVASLAISLAVQEAKDQGVAVEAPAVDNFLDGIDSRSQAITSVMASSITEAAARRALSEAAEGFDATALADSVRAHLESLTDTYLSDNFGAAIHTAQNDARFTTLDQGSVRKWYASELPDSPGICDPCEQVNDTEYETLADGRKDYPSGFYRLCAGYVRCRGTLICIYEAEQEPTVDDVNGGGQ